MGVSSQLNFSIEMYYQCKINIIFLSDTDTNMMTLTTDTDKGLRK